MALRRAADVMVGLLVGMTIGCAADRDAMREVSRTPAPALPQAATSLTSPSHPVPPAAEPAKAHRGGSNVTTIGYSSGKTPILMHTFGTPRLEPVLIIGGIHGNEQTSAGVCRELLSYLKSHPEVVHGRTVYLIPEANPDGLKRGMRTNAQLVDINRNFPALNWKKTRKSSYFGGDAAATEPETLALMEVVNLLRPARIVSVHSMDDPCNNYDGPADGLARLMAAHNGYEVRSNIGYPTPGSFGSWAGGDRRIPLITLELARRDTTATSWAKNREALSAFIRGS